jgi:hypothetical protein
VTVNELVAGVAQGAFGFAVIVNVTLPAVMSAPLGAYVVESSDALPNVPEPLVVHCVLEEFEAVAVMFTGPPPQLTWFGPAPAVGGGTTVTVTETQGEAVWQDVDHVPQ